MKLYPAFIALFTLFYLSSPPALAEDSAWKSSYNLETAGKYKEAIAAINLIPANGPDAELKTLRRGWLYYKLGQYNESIREYRYAIERNNQSIDGRLGVMLPLLAQARWREAELSARALLAIAPNNYTGLLRLTLALEGQKNWLEMEKVATAMVVGYPTDATSYVYLARAYAWLNKHMEAVAAYTAVLVRYPGHKEATAYITRK